LPRRPRSQVTLLALIAACACAGPARAWPTGVEAFTAADCARPSATETIEAALRRGATVVLPDGLPEGTDALAGIRADALPPWCVHAWAPARGPWDAPTSTAWAQALRLEPALLQGARLDPLVAAGRMEGHPEALVAFALRYYEGPRAGSCLVVLGRHRGGDPDWEALLTRLRQPYLLVAEPDYALVRPGEDLRIRVQAAIASSDVRDTRVELGIPTQRRLVRWLWQGSPGSWTREPRAHGPDRLSGEAIVPAQEWPARPLEIHARLVARNGDLLDELRPTVVVWTGRLTPRPALPSVSWRRLSVWGSDSPAFSLRLASAVSAVEPWTALGSGLRAWSGLLGTQADAGARTATLPVVTDASEALPEWRKRANQALVCAALASRISPELLFAHGTADQGALGDDAVAGMLAPTALVSATDAADLALLRATWPPGSVVPRPVEPEGALLALGPEGDARAGTRAVRARCEVDLSAPMLWQALLLGSAGVLVEDPRSAASPRLLEANVLSRLLRPGASPPEVPMLLEDAWRADEAALEAGGLLNAAGYDWGPVSAADPHQLPGRPVALVRPGGSAFVDSTREHMRAWLEAGGTLLVPRARVPELLADAGAPPSEQGPPTAWRVGKGWVAEWNPGATALAPSALAGFLAARGGSPVTATPSADVRVLRNVVADGSRLLGAFATPGSASRRVTLVDGEHSLDLGLSSACPAVGCFTATGPCLAESLGAFEIDSEPFLAAPDDCRFVVVSLDGLALRDSRSLLLFVDAQTPVELTLRLGRGAPRAASLRMQALLPTGGRLVVVAERGLERKPDGQRMRVRADELCTPILLSTADGLVVAQRRLAELVWGQR
jgi:hypothetical protein